MEKPNVIWSYDDTTELQNSSQWDSRIVGFTLTFQEKMTDNWDPTKDTRLIRINGGGFMDNSVDISGDNLVWAEGAAKIVDDAMRKYLG